MASTSVLTNTSGSPSALTVDVSIAGRRSEVTSAAAIKADSVGRIGHAHGGGTAVHHGSDGRALLRADTGVLIPDAVGVGLANFSSLATEAAARLAGGLGGVEVASSLALAFTESEGVVGTDEDLRASSGAGRSFRIPHAASIEDASTLRGVEHGAVADTALGGHVPGALRRTRALTSISDGEAAEETLGVLLVPFALRISVTVVGVGTSDASELADTRDGINSAVTARRAIFNIGALSIASLLGRVPQAVLRFTTFGVGGDGTTASTASLRGSRPFAATT